MPPCPPFCKANSFAELATKAHTGTSSPNSNLEIGFFIYKIDSLGRGLAVRRIARCGGNVAFGPDGAVGEIFLLPDGPGAFEGIDREAAGIECGGAMRRTDDDEDAGFAEVQAAEAMDDGDTADFKFFSNLRPYFGDFGEGHGLVGFVFEIERLTPAKIIAHEAIEDHCGAVFRRASDLDDILVGNCIAR